MVCRSYDILAGERKDDLIALELYRAKEYDRDVSDSTIAEMCRRFLEQPIKD